MNQLDIVHVLREHCGLFDVCLIDAEDIDVLFSGVGLEDSLIEGCLSPFYEVRNMIF